MKEETARALTLAACALQAYALAKSFKREVIDPYREPPKENDARPGDYEPGRDQGLPAGTARPE